MKRMISYPNKSEIKIGNEAFKKKYWVAVSLHNQTSTINYQLSTKKLKKQITNERINHRR